MAKGTTHSGSSNARKSETEKLKTENETVSKPKAKGGRNYKPKGMGNGGRREGSGRKKNLEKEEVKALKAEILQFLNEEGEMVVTDAKGQRVVKALNNLILIKTLFHEAVKNKNVNAIREIWDRAYGKAKQPVDVDANIVVQEQYSPEYDEAVQTALEAFYKTRDKIKHGRR